MSRQGYHYWSILRASTTKRRKSASRRSKTNRQSHFSVEHLEARHFLTASPMSSGLTGDADYYLASPPPVLDPEIVALLNAAKGGSGSEITDAFDPARAFQLHSLPGATKTIYLDFDGHLTRNTQWNTQFNSPNILTPPLSFDDDLVNFSDEERLLIYNIWQRVSEDFLPFQVNVTTQDPGEEALQNTGEFDDEWGIRVVIGGSTLDWYTPVTERGVGGVAYVGSFAGASDTPAFVFGADSIFILDPDNPYEFVDFTESFITEAVSHEVGHTLGLSHDGQTWPVLDVTDEDEDGEPDDPTYRNIHVEYYSGHGMLNNLGTSWAPIMGGGAGVLTQWGKGEYFWANNIQDDLEIITTQNGFTYRDDDHGSSTEDATSLSIVTDLEDRVLDEEGKFFWAEGIVERNTDVDYFSFVVEGLGEWFSFDISPFERGANLDVLATIRDSSDTVLFRSNPLDGIYAGSQTFGSYSDGGWAQLDALGNILGYVDAFSLLPGTYYLTVEGTGRPITFIDPAIHPGPVTLTKDDTGPDGNPFTADDLPDDESDWGYSDYGSLGYYSITGERKRNLVVGVDFSEPGGASPLNWNPFEADESGTTIHNLISEAGFETPYDLTVTTTGPSLNIVASSSPINPGDLPEHALPLDEISGYISASDGETLTFTWSDLDPNAVYQIFVFGHASEDIKNIVTIVGGEWNGVTQTYNFTQTIAAHSIGVNGDDSVGGEALSTLSLLVIANESGEIRIDVTNAEGYSAGIAGVAITNTKHGSLSGQKWNDVDGSGAAPDPGEAGLPGWLIYLDLNNNGILDIETTPDQAIHQDAPSVPQALLDYTTVKNELIIEQEGIIVDVNVTIDISHTYNGDVNVYLVAPDGTRVILVRDLGGNSHNFTNTTFDDSATKAITSITPSQAPFTGSYRPMTPLSELNGLNSAGTWTLEVEDDGPGNQGTLNAWSIDIEILGSITILEPYQITDADGHYAFEDIKPGLYYVREFIQPQQTIDGWRQTWAPAPVNVTSGGAITGIDFGNWIPIFSPGEVVGRVWDDLDGDGLLSEGESGLSDWIVYIDANKNGVRDVATTPTVYESTAVPRPILDFSTITSTIFIGDVGSVLSMEVTVDITHSFMADLEAFLTSPSGRIVELFSGVGAQFNDFNNLTLSDSAERSIISIGQADQQYNPLTDTWYYTGVWRPEVPLATFFGDESFGNWTLTIRDTAFADQGTLNSWSLSVITGELFAITDENGDYVFNDVAPGQYIVRQEMKPGWEETYAPTLIDGGLGNFYNIQVSGGSSVIADFGNQFQGPALPGDFTLDGVVDSADYIIYRKMFGMTVAPFYGADADGNGFVDADDLAIWRKNFGRVLESSGGGSDDSSALVAEAPAPAATVSSFVSQPAEEAAVETGISSASSVSTANYYVLAESNGTSQSSSSSFDSLGGTGSSSTSLDAAFLALISATEGGKPGVVASEDALALGTPFDDEACESLEGIDALFELIGA